MGWFGGPIATSANAASPWLLQNRPQSRFGCKDGWRRDFATGSVTREDRRPTRVDDVFGKSLHHLDLPNT
ncbi:MAG: hypothetical protein O3A31_13890, partial [Planctomycetota bacterium]|nr:hypothetical protein [Planctomycetota bacterium]